MLNPITHIIIIAVKLSPQTNTIIQFQIPPHHLKIHISTSSLFLQFSRPLVTVSTADISVLLCAEVYTFTVSRVAHTPGVMTPQNTSKVSRQDTL